MCKNVGRNYKNLTWRAVELWIITVSKYIRVERQLFDVNEKSSRNSIRWVTCLWGEHHLYYMCWLRGDDATCWVPNNISTLDKSQFKSKYISTPPHLSSHWPWTLCWPSSLPKPSHKEHGTFCLHSRLRKTTSLELGLPTLGSWRIFFLLLFILGQFVRLYKIVIPTMWHLYRCFPIIWHLQKKLFSLNYRRFIAGLTLNNLKNWFFLEIIT